MAEVKWIKITTDMFEHEKLDFILSLPEADAIVIVWIRLLTLAGKVNAAGYVLLTENIAYTEEMLAHKFRKPPSVIKLALETLKRLKMVEFDGEALRIANWDKHQNVDGMERIKEQNRLRKRKERAAKKLLDTSKSDDSHVTVTGQVTQSHAIEVEVEVEVDKEKESSTADDFDKVVSAFKELHRNVLDFPLLDSPLLTRMLEDGISADFIIDVMESKHKSSVKVFSYYKDAIREQYAKRPKFKRNEELDRAIELQKRMENYSGEPEQWILDLLDTGS
jgi:predicted phage replisome organizer